MNKRNEIVEQDLQEIAALISKTIHGVRAVVLEGSFGRDEGGVIERNGEVHPVNDYDLLIVTADHVDAGERKKAADRVSSVARVANVDLAFLAEKHLSSQKPTLANFDRKYGSRVIFGDSLVLESMPIWQAQDIPVREAEKLLITRAINFILVRNVELVRGVGDEEFFFVQQLSKSAIACHDSIEIMEGTYETSYVARALRVDESSHFTESEKNLIGSAFEFKLKPSDEFIYDKECFFGDCLSLYMKTFSLIFERMYRGVSFDPVTFKRYYSRDPRKLLIVLYQFLFGFERSMSRDVNLNLSVLYLLFSFHYEQQAEHLFGVAAQHLQHITKKPYRNSGYRDFVVDLISLRLGRENC